MFLLPSILLGVALALLLGGKPSRILEVRLRRPWLVVAALGVQVLLFSRAGAAVPEAVRSSVHLGTYVLLVLFALANLRVKALVPVLVGMLLNAVAITANGGTMPLSPSAAEAAGIPVEDVSNVSAGAGRLRFLGDVFAVPDGIVFANAFSVGDILIAFGMVAFIVTVSLGGGGEASLDPRRIVEPLRSSAYRRLAAGRLVSHLGDWLTIAALVGWVYDDTGSTGQVAAVMICRLAPPILGGSLAALVVDRLPKQRLLVWIEALRGLVVVWALLGVLADQHVMVLAALAISGALAAMSNTAVPAYLPSLLPEEQLASANAGLGIARNAAMAAGAGGAGLLLAFVGAGWALAADLATFAVAVCLFAGLRAAGAPVRSGEGVRGPGGLRYLLGKRTLLVLVLSFAAATIATGLTNASLPRFLDENSFGAGAYGFGLAALAAGLAVGQVFVGFSRVGPGAGRWIGTALLVMAGLFAVLAVSEHPATILLMLGLIGFVDGTTDVVFDTVVQREVHARYLGWVFGFASAFITTTMMGSFAIAPFLNAVLHEQGVILGAAAVLGGAGLVALVGMPRPAPAPAAARVAAG